MKREAQLRIGVRAVLLAAAAAAQAPAVAQSQDDSLLEAVVVTGSRIQRADLDASSPVAVFSRAELQLSGATNIEEYLRDVPQAVQAIGSSTNNGNPGAATIDLRNLGEQRTLVLVNGKRFVPFDADGAVDLNMIPEALIERVEILTGGASSIYGSDAVAGVVNMILRDDFEGLETDLQYGMTEKGDGDTLDASFTVGGGFADKRGHAVINISVTDQEAVKQGSRKFSEFALRADGLTPRGSFTDADGKLAGSFPTICSPEEINDGDCFADFAPNGDLVPVDSTFNFNPYNLLQVPHKKWTATALGKYEINDNVEAYARVSYANSKVKTVLAPTGTFFFPFTLNLDNPFLSSQAVGILSDADGDGLPDAAVDVDGDGVIDAGATVDISLGRRLPEIGTRDSIYENTAFQFVVGLTGSINESLRWDVFGQMGQTDRAIAYRNDVSFTRAQQAMLAVRDGDGNIVCQDTSGGCAPANYFGEGNISPEAAKFIALNLVQKDTTKQFVTGGSLSGDLPLTLPSASAPAAFAVGVEFRREKSERRPDENLILGNSIGFGASSPIDAEYEVKEGFAELRMPLIQDKAFAKSLAFSSSFRYAEYKNEVSTAAGTANSDFNNTTWSLGLDWAPIESVKFRATYSRAVRAPNISEIGLPLTFGTGNLDNDPCAGLLSSKPAALQTACLASGVPNNPGITVPGPIVGQINNFSGGNVALRPEKAKTLTLGVVLQPAALPNFTAAIDYYQIKINDAITAISEQNIVDACYGTGASGVQDSSFCSRIRRSALTGGLIGGLDAGVDVSLINSAFQKVRGLDIDLMYRLDTDGAGTFAFRLSATHVLKNQSQDAPLLDPYRCDGKAGPICDRPDPKTRFVQNTTWMYGPATVNLRWRYVGKITRDTIDPEITKNRIGAANYFDLTGSYEIGEKITLRAGVSNLFNKKPPVVGTDWGTTTENSANTYPATYDTLGRSYFLGVTAKF
jgi:iron complex outermembrane receptor protein